MRYLSYDSSTSNNQSLNTQQMIGATLLVNIIYYKAR